VSEKLNLCNHLKLSDAALEMLDSDRQHCGDQSAAALRLLKVCRMGKLAAVRKVDIRKVTTAVMVIESILPWSIKWDMEITKHSCEELAVYVVT
jgi:hypothetical protein